MKAIVFIVLLVLAFGFSNASAQEQNSKQDTSISKTVSDSQSMDERTAGPDDQIDEYPEETIPFPSLIKYPREAVRDSLEGRVTFEALIGKDGLVQKVEILKITNEIFR